MRRSRTLRQTEIAPSVRHRRQSEIESDWNEHRNLSLRFVCFLFSVASNRESARIDAITTLCNAKLRIMRAQRWELNLFDILFLLGAEYIHYDFNFSNAKRSFAMKTVCRYWRYKCAFDNWNVLLLNLDENLIFPMYNCTINESYVGALYSTWRDK